MGDVVGLARSVAWRALALPSLQTLRLLDTDAAAVRAASARLAFELALAPCRLTLEPPRSVRLAPGEWLVMGSSAEHIAECLGGVLHHVSDVTPGRVGWRIEGPAARDLLACGCSLDLHGKVFAPGACVRTLLAGIVVVLARPYEADGFDLIADRSLGAYLAAWLDDAAMGFKS